MAAKEVVNNDQRDIELVVNRWLLDYYFSLGLEFFQNDKKEDFMGIIEVFENVLKRPYEATLDTNIQIRLLQFLDKINDSESIAVSFDQIICLESALILLEDVNQEFIIQQEDYDRVHASLKELIVVILVKNGQFLKAEEMLKKHFPRPMVGKKAIFMGLIKKKSKSHQLIDQVDFQHFKQEAAAFCQKIYPMKPPFLSKAAALCIQKRMTDPGDSLDEPDEICEPGPSSTPPHNTSAAFAPLEASLVPMSRLEAAYSSLATGFNDKTFAEVKMEMTREDLSLSLPRGTDQDAEQDVSYQGSSHSPMEASPADQSAQSDADPQIQEDSASKTAPVPRKRRLYTVAQLVMEPDSQGSSQCTAASEEMEAEVRAEPTAAVTPMKTESRSPGKTRTATRTTRSSSREMAALNTSQSNLLSHNEEEDSASSSSTPVKRRQQSDSSAGQTSDSSPKQTPPQSPALGSGDVGDETTVDNVCIINTSLDSSPGSPAALPLPQTSSTPHKTSQHKGPSDSKWKQLFNNATESKEVWDEDAPSAKKDSSRSHHETSSLSGQRRRMWTEAETQKLIQGVKKFGEGNWSKIRAYYSFTGRTNVNLKDRWRTMKKTHVI